MNELFVIIKKYLVVIILLIAVVGVGGLLLFNKIKNSGKQEVISNQQETRKPTLEEVTAEMEAGVKNLSPDTLWVRIHPDDKTRWKDEEEYAEAFMLDNKNNPAITGSRIEATRVIDEWVHPVTGKKYDSVTKVTVETNYAGIKDPQVGTEYYKEDGGEWYFFSRLLSPKDKEEIKSQAQPGPIFKELSKNADKYKGLRVKYLGKVEQIRESLGSGNFIMLDITKDKYDFWSDAVFVSYQGDTEVLQDDIVTIYGVLTGNFTYTSQANYQITLPGMTAVYIEKAK